MAGKVVLLKVAFDSIPIYWFSLFKMPSSVLSHIDTQRRKFLWGSKSKDGVDSSKMHLMSWDKVCKPMAAGGLGLDSLRLRNLSLLLKWWWRCYNERNSLWTKVLREKYGPGVWYNLRSVVFNNTDVSPLQQIVYAGSSDIADALVRKDQFRWKVGNGENIFFWEDFWDNCGPLMERFLRLYALSKLKLNSLSQILQLLQGQGIETLDIWCRSLRAWEEEHWNTIQGLLQTITLSTRSDRLQWGQQDGKLTSKQ